MLVAFYVWEYEQRQRVLNTVEKAAGKSVRCSRKRLLEIVKALTNAPVGLHCSFQVDNPGWRRSEPGACRNVFERQQHGRCTQGREQVRSSYSSLVAAVTIV